MSLDLKYALREGIVKICRRSDTEQCVFICPQRYVLDTDGKRILFDGVVYSVREIDPYVDRIECDDEEWHNFSRLVMVQYNTNVETWKHHRELIGMTLKDWFVLNVVDRFRKKKSP